MNIKPTDGESTPGDGVNIVFKINVKPPKAAPVVEEEPEEEVVTEETIKKETVGSEDESILDEDDDVVPIPPPVFIVPKVVDITKKRKKDIPVEIVAYTEPAAKFARVEPTINAMTVSKKGQSQMSFTNSMKFPDDWKARA